MKNVVLILLTLAFGFTAIADEAATNPSIAAETATAFLKSVENGNIDDALSLWDARQVNDAIKARLAKMHDKIATLKGIQRIDIGTTEQRRIDSFEKKTGERVDFVPVEIIFNNEKDLALAVFSIRKLDGAYRIFELESLKEWGGTVSLDEELPYRH